MAPTPLMNRSPAEAAAVIPEASRRSLVQASSSGADRVRSTAHQRRRRQQTPDARIQPIGGKAGDSLHRASPSTISRSL